MPYNSIITRSEADALIPDEVSRDIIQSLPTSSFCLATFRRTTMSRKQVRQPVLSALPVAYWVNGDTGLKQTTEMAWANKYLVAEELAALVPIPQAVLDDSDFDIWGEVRPRIVEALGKALDQAIIFGVNKPSTWPAAIIPAATSAGHAVEASGGASPPQDLAADINDVMALVEADGFDVNGFAAAPTLKAQLRGLRDANKGLLFQPSLTAGTPSTLYGEDITFVKNGSWNASTALLVAGDWTQGIIAVRQDVSYRILDQAVIQDNTGAIIYNLAQQDMVALRVTARFAFQIANPITALNQNDATRYPFAVLTPYTP
jgi:HK97 family phage major capsid protein